MFFFCWWSGHRISPTLCLQIWPGWESFSFRKDRHVSGSWALHSWTYADRHDAERDIQDMPILIFFGTSCNSSPCFCNFDWYPKLAFVFSTCITHTLLVAMCMQLYEKREHFCSERCRYYGCNTKLISSYNGLFPYEIVRILLAWCYLFAFLHIFVMHSEFHTPSVPKTLFTPENDNFTKIHFYQEKMQFLIYSKYS